MKTTVRLRKLSYWHDEIARLAKEGSASSVIRRALLDHECVVSPNAVKKYIELWEERGWPSSAELGYLRLQKKFHLEPWVGDLEVSEVSEGGGQTGKQEFDSEEDSQWSEVEEKPEIAVPVISLGTIEEWVPGGGKPAEKAVETVEPKEDFPASEKEVPKEAPKEVLPPPLPEEKKEVIPVEKREQEVAVTGSFAEMLEKVAGDAIPEVAMGRTAELFSQPGKVPFSVGGAEGQKEEEKKSSLEVLERGEIAESNRSAIVQSPQVEKSLAELREGDPLGAGWRGYESEAVWWEVLIGDLKKQLDEERAMRWSGRQVDYGSLRWEELGWFDIFGMYRWGNKDYETDNEIKELFDRVYMQSRKYVMINWQEGAGNRKTLFVVTPGSRLQKAIAEKMDYMHMPRWWRRKMEVDGWVLPSAAGWDNDDGRGDEELGIWTMRTPKFQKLKAKLLGLSKGEEEPLLPEWYLKKTRSEWLQGLPAGRI